MLPSLEWVAVLKKQLADMPSFSHTKSVKPKRPLVRRCSDITPSTRIVDTIEEDTINDKVCESLVELQSMHALLVQVILILGLVYNTLVYSTSYQTCQQR